MIENYLRLRATYINQRVAYNEIQGFRATYYISHSFFHYNLELIVP